MALLANEPESEAVAQQFAIWAKADAELHAPELARYEVANALARKRARSESANDDLAAAWAELDDPAISYDWDAPGNKNQGVPPASGSELESRGGA